MFNLLQIESELTHKWNEVLESYFRIWLDARSGQQQTKGGQSSKASVIKSTG